MRSALKRIQRPHCGTAVEQRFRRLKDVDGSILSSGLLFSRQPNLWEGTIPDCVIAPTINQLANRRRDFRVPRYFGSVCTNNFIPKRIDMMILPISARRRLASIQLRNTTATFDFRRWSSTRARTRHSPPEAILAFTARPVASRISSVADSLVPSL